VLADQKKLEEAFRLLEAGKESFRSLEAKLGFSKSTLHRWYFSRLEKRVEERKKELVEVEGKISNLMLEFSKLEGKYKEKNRLLEEDYSKRKVGLEEEIAKLKGETEAVKAQFEKQGLVWVDGVKILKETCDLRSEKELLQGEISNLKAEAEGWREKVKQERLIASQLEIERKRLNGAVSGLSSTYRYYLGWIQYQAPNIERYKAQLEKLKAELEGEVKQKTGIVGKLQSQIGELELEINRLEDARKATALAFEAEKTRVKEETDELLRKATELANRIIGDAKAEEEKTLKRVEKLEAEGAFLEAAVKTKIKELKAGKHPG